MITTIALFSVKLILAVLGAASLLQTGTIAVLDCAFGCAAAIYSLTSLTLEKKDMR